MKSYNKFKETCKPFPIKKKTFLGRNYRKDSDFEYTEYLFRLSDVMYGEKYSLLNKIQKEQVISFGDALDAFEVELYEETKEVLYLSKYIEILSFKLKQKEELADGWREAYRLQVNKGDNTNRYNKGDDTNRHNKKSYCSPKKTYLIKEENTSFYKIGKSNNPEKREKTLQREKPNIKIVKVWGKDIEKELHRKYSKQRIRGEWFRLTSVQVKHICTTY